VKQRMTIDLNERELREIFGERYTGNHTDEELHQIMQELIESDHRLLVESNLIAWHEAHHLNSGKHR